jgi:hypothetical protein
MVDELEEAASRAVAEGEASIIVGGEYMIEHGQG